MKNRPHLFTSFLTILLLLMVNQVSAQTVPFQTTTIQDGAFAETTPWYTMTITNKMWLISNPGDADKISLDKILKDVSDDDLWCFVGDETNGYHIYNKAAGMGKMLCAPTTMLGKTGKESYVVLRDVALAETDGYTGTWCFASSDDIEGENGVYLYEKGYESNKVNNRDNILAFWTGGQDHGSTLLIKFAYQRLRVNMDYGIFTKSNSNKTYFAQWTSNQAKPQLTLTVGSNNMDTSVAPPELRLYNGKNNVYTLQVSNGFAIKGFEFDFNNYDASLEVTASCGNYFKTAYGNEVTHFSVSEIHEQTADIVLESDANAFICTNNFYVDIEPSKAAPVVSTELFITQSGEIPYRIPAIAKAHNGDLLAISDYRYCKADIGNGRIDLYQRISHDNGITWEPYSIVVSGDGVMDSRGRNYSLTAGYGDACIVADCESDEVLMMSVCGYQTFPGGTRSTPNQVARFRSHDNGATWSAPEVITETFYVPFDVNCTRGPIRSMFIGSGKIHQSRYVKAGQYYRLYCSSLTKDVNGVNCNYVWYSDDFGETWNVLGDVNTPAIPSGADEPKTEELPDGSVLVSSRCTGGRLFNIFRFTNPEKAEGSWMTYAGSNSSNNGVVAVSNSCNGEVLMLPARRNSDQKTVFVALQSLPFGSGRTNVGIYYKELSSYDDDYKDPATFAKNWDGRKQISKMGSAYSTMVLQDDQNIGFLYEESTYGADYTIVYRSLSLEEITDSAYTYLPDASPGDFGIVNVTYVLMEDGQEIDRVVLKQSAYSEAAVPSTWQSDEYDFDIEGTIGNTDCTITVTRTLKPNHTRTVKQRVANLEIGKQYAIFNTAVNGTEARYGFYYAGTSTALYCSNVKPADFTVSDTYLWTVEDGGNGYFCFRNVSTGTYISATQRVLSANPMAWKVEEWTVSTESHATVNSINEAGQTIANADITAEDKVFTVVNPNGSDKTRCWNGNEFSQGDSKAPALWSNAHPFAFYEIRNVVFIYVTYILMENGKEIDRVVVEQEAGSAVAFPEEWNIVDTTIGVEGTIGNENCTIIINRTPTGIERVAVPLFCEGDTYDLLGRTRVKAGKGVYIIKGKKVVVK